MTAKNTAQRAFAVMSGPEQGGGGQRAGGESGRVFSFGRERPGGRPPEGPGHAALRWVRVPAYSPGFAFHNPDGELRLFQGRSSKETSSDVRQTDSRGPVLT